MTYRRSPPAPMAFVGRNGGTGETEDATSAIFTAGCRWNVTATSDARMGATMNIENIDRTSAGRSPRSAVASDQAARQPTATPVRTTPPNRPAITSARADMSSQE